ncbi:MAG: hypothetical protein QM804_04085 [Propionicimonas sp.]
MHPFDTPEGVDMFLWQGEDEPAALALDVRDDLWLSDGAEIAKLARELSAASRLLTEPEPLVVEPVATPKKMDHTRNDGFRDVYGTCTKWCYVQTDFVSEPGGNPVADHGLWCAATAGHVQSQTADGFVAHTHIGLARPYFHGTYPAGTMKNPARSDVYVRTGTR